MDLRGLIADLPGKTGMVHTFEGGNALHYSHASLHGEVMRVRQALLNWRMRPGMRVGIYAPNSLAWMIHDLALIDIGAISVPFTDDFAGQVNDELLARYDVALLLTSKSHAKDFPQMPAHVAFIDADNDGVRALDRMPKPEADSADQHSLVFSSGSAGGLKGLVISRKGIEDTLLTIYGVLGLQPGDRVQLFLPLSNLQQRNMCYGALLYDIDLIITDYTQLFTAMKVLQPTLLIAPPVLYQMIHGEFERLPDEEKHRRMMLAKAVGLVPLASWRIALARKFFKDFHDQFGGQMRMLVTGMAPIRRELGAFFECMQLPLCESYGMVEAGSITWRAAGSREYSSVGKVLPGVRLTFEDDGEIVVHRDHPLTLRYFQAAEGENERTFVGPGRIATGDIGHMDSDGNVYLQGRKREQITTPGGYKVHPEVIENQLNHSPDVAQSVVFLKPGASQLTCVVALQQPELDGARERVKKYAAGLSSIKKIAQFIDVIYADEIFTRENGMLRPNMKLDRKAIAAKYG
jgi:long-subunit acyl-CoA synthetase (AMP-forming)